MHFARNLCYRRTATTAQIICGARCFRLVECESNPHAADAAGSMRGLQRCE